jgi:ATP-binding cassette, subfamily B, bacterial
MRLIEPAEAHIEQQIADRLSTGEEPFIQVFSDLDAEGCFGRRWLAVTPDRILVLSPDSPDDIVEVAVKRLKIVRTEALVSAARLEIEQEGAPTVYVPYSNSLGNKFSEVARALEQLRKGEDLLFRTEMDRVRCAKCDRLLPEKNGLCPACVSRLATIGRIGSYLKPYKGRALGLALASVATTTAELAPPMIIKNIVDEVIDPFVNDPSSMTIADGTALLGMMVLALIVVRVGSWIAEFSHDWIVSWLGARVTADIRSLLYRRLEMLSLQFYDKRQVGALMSRVTQDSGMLQEFLVEGVPYLLINGLMIFGILGIMSYMNWELTLYILIPVPLLLIWGIVFWHRMRRYFHKWRTSWSHLTARLHEALSGIRVVKAFAQEERELAEFNRRNAELLKIGVTTDRNWYVFFATMNLVTGLGVASVWYFGGKDVIEDQMSLGTLLAFYSYMWLLYGPIQWFGQVNSWMTRAFAGAERIFEVIDSPPEAYDDPDAIDLPALEGRVHFKGMSFGYDKSKPVLHDIDLDIAPGEMIGLVGKSGVGKTTTVNLIARFYDVDHGSIEIDGIDIKRIRLQDLRRQIGIVLQEPFLFSGSIAENIGYGKPGAPLDQIMEAARAANAHNFIMAKPDGYNTEVGERGSSLSGGERQRVSIARAILHDPGILILDEATSSVDVETEKQIQEAIGRLVKGRTTFAIAHRLSTLRHAGRLVVLDAGRIVEAGTHAELMERQGHFYKLVKLQEETSQIIAIRE